MTERHRLNQRISTFARAAFCTMSDHGAALLEQPGVGNSAQAKTNPSQNKHGKCSHKKQNTVFYRDYDDRFKQEVRRATHPLSCVPPSLGLTLALTGRPLCTMKPHASPN